MRTGAIAREHAPEMDAAAAIACSILSRRPQLLARLRRPKNLAGEIRRAANRTYARAAVTRLEVRTTGVERGDRARRLVARVAFAYGRRAIVVDARLKPTFLRTLTSRTKTF